MEAIFDPRYYLLWALALGVALFFPVRNLIWVQYVRRAQKSGNLDEMEKQRLRKRSGVTAGLICLVFSILYTSYLFFR